MVGKEINVKCRELNMSLEHTIIPLLLSQNGTLLQGCQTHGLLGATLHGPHDAFDLEITTSTDNRLCNVARSEIDLQKKVHYLSSTSTPSPFFRHD